MEISTSLLSTPTIVITILSLLIYIFGVFFLVRRKWNKVLGVIFGLIIMSISVTAEPGETGIVVIYPLMNVIMDLFGLWLIILTIKSK